MQNIKIKRLLIGTNNVGKLREIRDLLPKYIKTLSTSEFNLKSQRENGKTFLENYLIKSKSFSASINDCTTKRVLLGGTLSSSNPWASNNLPLRFRNCRGSTNFNINPSDCSYFSETERTYEFDSQGHPILINENQYATQNNSSDSFSFVSVAITYAN